VNQGTLPWLPEGGSACRLDLAQAIALRAIWAGIGWPGRVTAELESKGLVRGTRITTKGLEAVHNTPEGLHNALLEMAWTLRRGMRK